MPYMPKSAGIVCAVGGTGEPPVVPRGEGSCSPIPSAPVSGRLGAREHLQSSQVLSGVRWYQACPGKAVQCLQQYSNSPKVDTMGSLEIMG